MEKAGRLVEVVGRSDGALPDVKGVEGSGLAGRLLAGFLVLDLQGGARLAADVLAKLAMVNQGELPKWQRVGNAYILEIYPDRAILEEQYPDDHEQAQATIELAALEDATREWARALDPRQ